MAEPDPRKEEFEAHWEQRLREQYYLQRTANPESMAAVYNATPTSAFDVETAAADPLDPADRKFRAYGQLERSNFAKSMDTAYTQNRGNIPLSFWTQFSPERLQRLITQDMLDEFGDDMNEAMRLRSAQFHSEEQFRKEELVEEEYQKKLRSIEWTAKSTWASDAYMAQQDLEQIRADIHTNVFKEWDKEYDDQIDAFLETSRAQLMWVRDHGDIASLAQLSEDGTTKENPFPDMTSIQLRTFFDGQAEFLEAMEVTDLTDLTNAKIDELMETQERFLRNQVNEAEGKGVNEILSPGDTIGFWGQGGRVLAGTLDKVMTFGGIALETNILTAPAYHGMNEIVTHFVGTEQDARDEQAAEIRAEHGFPDEELFAREFAPMLQEAWAEVQEDRPDQAEEYFQMAAGDPTLAMGFFGADLQQQLTPEQQTEFIGQIHEQDEIIIEAIQDADFTVGSKMMHFLGGLDRLGPARLNTYMTLLIDDTDYFDKAIEGAWVEQLVRLEKTAAQHGYSAAKALDIDGSLAGFLLDIGGSIFFDPTTWLMGPTGAAVRSGTSKSILRQSARDIVRFANDPSRGPGAIYQMLDWVDPITRGTVVRKMGFNSKIIPRGTWADDAQKAQVMNTRTLRGLLTKPERKGINKVDTDDLRHSLSERGFDEAIEVSMSRTDGKIWVSDGARRIMASEGEFSHIPVRIRITDDVSQGGRKVDDLLEKGESINKVFKQPGDHADAFARPSALLPERLTMGEFGNSDEILELLIQAEKNGAVYTAGQGMAVARASGETMRKLLRANAPGRWIERHITPSNLMKSRHAADPHAVDDLLSDVGRMYGADTVSVDEHMGAILDWEMKHGANAAESLRQLQELAPRQQRLLDLIDETGGMFGGRAKLTGKMYDNLSNTQKKAYGAKRKLIAQEDKYVKAQLLRIDKATNSIGATDELQKITLNIWDDFNRKHIAPMWAKSRDKSGKLIVGDDGLVPWEHLKRGLTPPGGKSVDNASMFSEDMLKIADDLEIDADKLMAQLSHSQNSIISFETPLSPLEMIIASSISGAAYTKATQVLAVHNLRNVVHAVHNLWTVDKVFTVATAATVSFDELLRIYHRFGHVAFFRWVADRGIYFEARVRAVMQGGLPRKGVGAEKLSLKKQERLDALKNYGARLKGAERQSYGEYGLGFQDILPGDREFRDAAARWSAGMLQDSGFRAYLGGRESFRKWFLSPDGERLRLSPVMTGKKGNTVTMLADSADDFYDGWDKVFDKIILKPAHKAGKYKEVRTAWNETAEKISKSGGIPHDVPDIAINHMDAVRGVRKELPQTMGISQMTESFFDNLFMNPVNYRRGFLAELVRTQEKARLTTLFNKQGRKVVSDVELERLLGIQGLAGAQKTGLQGAVHQMALRSGVIPESYIDNLVERAVRTEIENTLYQFDKGSRMGAQAKAVFPFGKPWADMAAFWGREMVRKPVLRGYVNEKNLFYLKSLNAKSMIPINRSQMMVSRLANTDFTIDKGLIGGEGEGFLHEGGLVPGSESTNFSPLFFLPTEGENPFSYMIPGIGIVPVFMISALMASLYDPVEEPEEYQKLQTQIAQVLPSVQYMQGSVQARFAGGGTTSKIALAASDISGMLGNSSQFNSTRSWGDITKETAAAREMSALLADPDELEILMSAETVLEAEVLLEALSIKANQNASSAHLKKLALRAAAPIKGDFSASLAEIQDVWLDATNLSELAHLAPSVSPENMSDEGRRQLAADVRTAFFSLDGWERDMMIVQQPSLAVNLVGSWEWTAEAEGMNVEGSDRTYRSGGSKKALAKHEALVRQGLIRPVQPIVRARRILGIIDAAKRAAAKELYVTQVDRINDTLWTFAEADEETQAMLTLVRVGQFGKRYDLKTNKEVWEHWGRLEEDFELYVAGVVGVDPIRGVSTRKADITEFDDLRKMFGIDSDFKAWNNDWTGLDEDNLTRKFSDFPIFGISDKSAKLADALGIEMEIGMLGGELYETLQQNIAQRESPIMDAIRPHYDDYIKDRTTQTARDMMNEAMQSDLVAPAVQDKIKEFLFKDMLLRERRKEDRRNGLSLADQNRMREEFLYIMHGAKDPKRFALDPQSAQKTDWLGIWDVQYKRFYGELDWVAPEPRPPMVDGQLQNEVMVPIVEHVVDGDTILFRMDRNNPTLSSVRLLGIRAPELSEGQIATDATNKLTDALMQAVEDGVSIYLVRDERFGDTDHYGRMLAWLWIGDTPFYNPEDFRPHQTPSGGS